jgi:hypothetical protein
MNAQTRAAGLAAAVAERDPARLAAELTEDIRLRALLPGGPVEKHGRDEVLAEFDGWFRDYRVVQLADASGEDVSDRLLVHYRLIFEPDEDPHVLTQTWIASVNVDGLIFRIDLLCSGFRKF